MNDVQTGVRRALNGFDRVVECSRADCHNPAEYRVGMKVWAKGTPQQAENYAQLRLPLVVCEACRETTQVNHIVDGDGWAKIVKAMRSRGRADPDPKTMVMEFEPLIVGQG